MDYEDLAKSERFEIAEKHLYKAVKSISDISQAGKAEFEKAKGNLSIVSPKSNVSLYDHLSAILRRILRFNIEDPVDKLEDISLAIKSEKQNCLNSEIIEVTSHDEVLSKFIEEKKKFYKLQVENSRESIRTAEEDNESDDEEEGARAAAKVSAKDEEEDSEPSSSSSALLDLHYGLHRFELAGIGLSPDEVHELGISLQQLSESRKLQQLRFWGKLFAVSCSYYVVESPYREEPDRIEPEDFGWKPDKAHETPVENSDATEAEGEEDGKEEPQESHDDTTDGEPEQSEASESRVIPPIPQPKPPKQKTVPPEENGTGINDKLYFVCTQIGHPWRCLPSLKPHHITDARRIKRYLTGDLESEVGGFMPYRGKEAHYLRAQIARISASTYISPDGYYQSSDEAVEDDEETGTPKALHKNESYEFKTPSSMYSESFTAWVHCRPAILDQGRCTPIKAEDLEDIGEEEEPEEEEKDEDEEGKSETKGSDEEEIFEALKEAEVPILRSIAEDRALGRLQPWTLKLSSKIGSATSILILRSNLWPGASTFYDGKAFDSIYIGFGHKYSSYHYAPAITLTWQKEFEAGSDLVEPEDSEVDEPLESEKEDFADTEDSELLDDEEVDDESD